MPRHKRLPMDEFTRAYIEAALWSSTDDNGEPLDKNYGADDLAPATYDAMANDCYDFQERFSDQVAGNRKRAGHDFWLTRNGHGAGFWDGDWPEPDATTLDEGAKSYGSFELYIGDDGLIYASGHEGAMNEKRSKRTEEPSASRKDWHKWRYDVINQISALGKAPKRPNTQGIDASIAEAIFEQYEEEMKQRYRNRENPRDVAQNTLEVWKQDGMPLPSSLRGMYGFEANEGRPPEHRRRRALGGPAGPGRGEPTGRSHVDGPPLRGRKSAAAYDFLRWSPGWAIIDDVGNDWLVAYQMASVQGQADGEPICFLRQESRIWHAFYRDPATGSGTTPRSALTGRLGDVIVNDRQMAKYCRLVIDAPEKLSSQFAGLYEAQSQCENEMRGAREPVRRPATRRRR